MVANLDQYLGSVNVACLHVLVLVTVVAIISKIEICEHYYPKISVASSLNKMVVRPISINISFET